MSKTKKIFIFFLITIFVISLSPLLILVNNQTLTLPFGWSNPEKGYSLCVCAHLPCDDEYCSQDYSVPEPPSISIDGVSISANLFSTERDVNSVNQTAKIFNSYYSMYLYFVVLIFTVSLVVILIKRKSVIEIINNKAKKDIK